jgi:RHS repeat-associated protein
VLIHHFLKVHYLSGAVLIQTTGVADSLYYSYSDAQGSLIALVHDGGSIIQRFAYDPWGARRDPNDWNVKDSRTSFIINRGYTGHEHLDAFGIINMNGRVYDPLTAQFFSPDPYVQAPGNWLNYNRYTYCSGNPFRYTDPSGDLQLGPFYLSLNIGWSPQGGLSLGISGGVGLEGGLYAGFSLNYGFKNSNFTATLNAGAGGGYAYAGYDTKAGWITGAGYAIPSAFSIWSPINITTNMMSAGIDYSQNGGFSANAGGFSYGSGGFSFNPSIGVSITGKFGDEYMKGSDNVKLDPNDNSGKPDVAYGDNEGINKKADKMMKRPSKLNKIYADGTGDVGAQEGEYVYAKTHWKGWTADVYLSEGAFKSNHFLSLTLQHEYSHIYITNRLGFARDRNRLYNENLNEYTAWSVTLEQAKIWGEYVKFAESQVNYYNIDNYKPIYAPNSIMTFKKIPW